RAVRSQLGVVITIIALTTFAAALVTLRQPTKYAATTTFVVRTIRTGETDTESTVRTLAALLQSNAVGADVVREARLTLTPSQVANEISVSRPRGAGVWKTTVTDVSRHRALRIAEVLVPVFAD